MNRSIIIVDHDGDFDAEAAAEAVGEVIGVDDVIVVSDSATMLVTGNAFDGLSLFGPFSDQDTAEEAGEAAPGGEYIIVQSQLNPS